MRNWCKSMYVIDGDAKEVRELYELMKGLQRRKEPFVRNGFGTTWLGCLLNALGYECYYMANCQGAWFHLEMVGDTLRFTTETISSPQPLAFDFVCKKYPSLACYYRAEEPVTILFETNDRESKYFPEKYRVEVFTPECEFLLRYFIQDLPITQTNITSSLLQSFCLCLVLQKPFCSSLPFSLGRKLSSWMECL